MKGSQTDNIRNGRSFFQLQTMGSPPFLGSSLQLLELDAAILCRELLVDVLHHDAKPETRDSRFATSQLTTTHGTTTTEAHRSSTPGFPFFLPPFLPPFFLREVFFLLALLPAFFLQVCVISSSLCKATRFVRPRPRNNFHLCTSLLLL